MAFEDERLPGDKFAEAKASGRLPFGQLPILTVKNTVFTQSDGILRYCGKQAGLYPRDDDLAAFAIDEVLGVVQDVTQAIFKDRGLEKEQLKTARRETVKVAFPKFFGGLEKIVKGRAAHDEWLCGNSITVADLSMYYVIGNICHGFVDHISEQDLQAYPRIMASYKAVEKNPKISSWNQKHPWKK